MSIFQSLGKILFNNNADEVIYTNSFTLPDQKFWSAKLRNDATHTQIKAELEDYFRDRHYSVPLFSGFPLCSSHASFPFSAFRSPPPVPNSFYIILYFGY